MSSRGNKRVREEETVVEKQKRQRKTKKFRKDQNAPACPPRPYIAYANKVRPTLLKHMGTKYHTIGEISKDIGKMWAKVSDREKAKYKSAFDKQWPQYHKELDAYKQTDDYKTYMQEKEAWKMANSTKAPRDPNAPKRPVNPFLQFVSNQQEKHGTIMGQTAAETMKTYSEKWNKMSDKKKEKYQKIFKKQIENYHKAKVEYEKTDDYKRYKEALDAYKKRTDTSEITENAIWECSKCSKHYTKNGVTLASHLVKCEGATATKYFQCEKCLRLFKAGTRGQPHVFFLKHMEECDEEPLSTTKNAVWECSKCTKHYAKNGTSLASHLAKCEATAIKHFQCEKCLRLFKHRGHSFMKHIKQCDGTEHEAIIGEFKCETCGKHFVHDGAVLAKHITQCGISTKVERMTTSG